MPATVTPAPGGPPDLAAHSDWLRFIEFIPHIEAAYPPLPNHLWEAGGPGRPPAPETYAARTTAWNLIDRHRLLELCRVESKRDEVMVTVGKRSPSVHRRRLL